MTPRTGWWRENRWWLLALPVAPAVLLGASAYNVKEYWYDGGLHDRLASADAGASLTATDRYEDAIGETSRTYRVRLAVVRPRRCDLPRTGRAGPDHRRAPPPWRVWLDWEADPDQTLRLLHGLARRRPGPPLRHRHARASSTPARRRVTTVPTGPLSRRRRPAGARGGERPPAWSTAPVFLVPEGRRITQVRVWWELPDYVQLSVP